MPEPIHVADLPSPAGAPSTLVARLLWAMVAIVGAACLGVVALRRGEPVNAIWLVAASLAVFAIAYRFYSRFIASFVLRMDATRATPAMLRNDGLDYVPTNKWVVFGHHFAAIAGAGPLVGPVLAAQMGYLPGTLWILFGVVFAGAVQDFMILALSLRRDGRSLGHMLREELGPAPGVVAMFGVLVLMMIVLAVLALVVVKALTHSPWGTFTVAATIPIALLMGVYLRWIRPGRILEVSLIGLALIAAASLHPGVYFAMNAPSALIGSTVQSAATAISQMGFVITPDELLQTAKNIGETSILSRAGGAPTLAVGMAQLLHNVLPSGGMMAFWYHYAILFEALFILTTVDAGTRVGRFMIQEIAGLIHKPLQATESWTGNLLATAICVALWGYFLYQGATDPLGGINTLWPLFGIANQMLAAIALMLATVVVVKLKRQRYVWVPGIPALWLIICTLTAGWQKLVGPISFTAAASKYAQAAQQGHLLAPARSIAEMQRIVSNNHVDAALTGLFMLLIASMLGFSLRALIKAWNTQTPTAREEPYIALVSVAH